MHRKWWTLIVVSVATFMLLLDITVVNTALPAIEEDLGASFTELQWVIDAYTLSLAALVLTAGVLADRLGRRRVFAAGLAIFTVASLLAGFAPDPTFLNLARGLQGVGGAIMFAVSLALVAQEFKPGRERGMAMGVYGATIGVSVAFGPLVGGALVDGIGWESIFFLNVPVGIAAVALTYAKLAESRDPNASRIDWAGLVTFSSALFLLVFGLLRGNEEGWGSTMIVGLLGGRRGAPCAVHRDRVAGEAADAAASPVPEARLHRRAARGARGVGVDVRAVPLPHVLPAGLPRPRPARGGAALPALHDRDLLRLGGDGSADLEGAGAGAAERRARHHGDRAPADGRPRPGRRVDRAAGRVPARGAGVGLINPVIADVAVSVVPKEQSGMAAGINDTFRQVGIAVGIAAWGAIFLGRGAAKVEEVAAGTPAATGERPRQLVEAVSSGNLDEALASVPPGARDQVATAANEGFLAGLNDILMLGGILSIAGAAGGPLAGAREGHRARREPIEVEAPHIEREPVPEPA